MALIVQDPVTPVAVANSYISLVDARSLAGTYGYTLDADDTDAELSLIKSFRAIELKEPEMCGYRSTTTQGTAYPRSGVVIRCNELPSDEFPVELLLAQVIGAHYFTAGTDLSGGVDDGKSVVREKVDVIEVQYADNGKTGSEVTIPELERTLGPLLCSSSNSFNFVVGRA